MPNKILNRFINIYIKQKNSRVLLLPSLLINFILPLGFIYSFSEFILKAKAIDFILIFFLNSIITILFLFIFRILTKLVNANLHLKIFVAFFILYFLSLIYFQNSSNISSLLLFNSIILPIWSYGKLLSLSIGIPTTIGKNQRNTKLDSFEFFSSAISLGLYFLYTYIFVNQRYIIFVGIIFMAILFVALFTTKVQLVYRNVYKSNALNGKNYEHSKKFYYTLIFSSALSVLLFSSVQYLYGLNLFILRDNVESINFLIRALIIGFLFVSLGSFFAFTYSKQLVSKLGLYLSLQIYPLIGLFFMFLLLLVVYSIGFSGYIAFFFMSIYLILEFTVRYGIYQHVLLSLIFSLNKNIGKKWLQIFIITFNVAFVVSALLFGLIFLYSSDLKEGYLFILWLSFFIAILIIIFNYFVYKISRNELANIASYKKLFVIDDYDTDCFGIDILSRRLNSENIEEVKLSTIILAEVNPRKLEPFLPVLFRHRNPIINRAILRSIDMSFDSEVVTLIEKFINLDEDDELRNQYHIIKNFFSPERIKKYDNSDTKTYKIEILKEIKEKPYLLNRRFLVKLDQEDDLVIRSLIGIVSKSNNYHSVDYLSYWIKHEKYMHYIADFLVEIGDDILSLLENFFYHTKPDVELIMKIIEVYGRVASDYSIELLFNHINYPNTGVQRLILNTLNSIHFQAKASKKEIVFRKIYFLAQNITWLLSYRENFIKDNRSLAMIPVIDSELKSDFKLLVSNLKLIYSKELIDLVEENIKKNNYLYASEMLQSVIDPELKNVVLPLIENMPNYKIIRKLNVYFAIENLSVIEQLKNMIKSYPIRISDTTRARSIEVLAGFYRKKKFNKWTIVSNRFKEIEWSDKEIEQTLQQISGTNIPDELFLGIFHTSPLVYTTAATVLYNINPARASYFLSNFDENRQKLLKMLENVDEEKESTFLERLKYLKRVNAFADVSVEILVFIANFIKLVDIKEGDFLSWKKSPADDVILVYSGIFRLKQNNRGKLTFSKDDILIKGLNVEDQDSELIAQKSGKLLVANRTKYFKTLALHEELLRKLYKNHLGVNI